MDTRIVPGRNHHLKAFKPPQCPHLLVGPSLAITTGSIVILGASLLTEIVWWMGNPLNQSHQEGVSYDHWLCLNPIWTEAGLGIAMFLMALLTFSIRSL